jgi:hypothetical protein
LAAKIQPAPFALSFSETRAHVSGCPTGGGSPASPDFDNHKCSNYGLARLQRLLFRGDGRSPGRLVPRAEGEAMVDGLTACKAIQAYRRPSRREGGLQEINTKKGGKEYRNASVPGTRGPARPCSRPFVCATPPPICCGRLTVEPPHGWSPARENGSTRAPAQRGCSLSWSPARTILSWTLSDNRPTPISTTSNALAKLCEPLDRHASGQRTTFASIDDLVASGTFHELLLMETVHVDPVC